MLYIIIQKRSIAQIIKKKRKKLLKNTRVILLKSRRKQLNAYKKTGKKSMSENSKLTTRTRKNTTRKMLTIILTIKKNLKKD